MRARLAAAALLFVAFAACGGGGGGGGGTPTAPPPQLAFTPASSGGAGSIALATAAGSSSSTLRLDLVANGAADLFGVSFELVYPTQPVLFVAATEGTFLSSGGMVPTTFQLLETEPGRLLVGLSRLGDVAGAEGTGTLLTLELSAVAAGSGAVSFEDARAFDSAGDEIAGTTFSGGTVTYTP